MHNFSLYFISYNYLFIIFIWYILFLPFSPFLLFSLCSFVSLFLLNITVTPSCLITAHFFCSCSYHLMVVIGPVKWPLGEQVSTWLSRLPRWFIDEIISEFLHLNTWNISKVSLYILSYHMYLFLKISMLFLFKFFTPLFQVFFLWQVAYQLAGGPIP